MNAPYFFKVIFFSEGSKKNYMGKKKSERQNRRAERVEKRRQFQLDKRKEKTERTRLRTSAKTDVATAKWSAKENIAESKSEADKVAYENGIKPTSNLDFAESVVNTIGTSFGKLPSGNEQIFSDESPITDIFSNNENLISETQPKKSNIFMYALAIIAGLFLMSKKSN